MQVAYYGESCCLRQEIEHEVHEARAFPHRLDTLYIVTDAPRDSHTQIAVDTISNHERKGGSFRIVLWFWDTVCERLAAHPKLLIYYYPDHFRLLTTSVATERLLDTPIQIVLLNPNQSPVGEALANDLRMRGIRVYDAKPPMFDEVALDGLAFYFDHEDSREQLRSQIVSVMQLLLSENSTIPYFIISPQHLQHLFAETIDQFKIEQERLCFYSPTTAMLADRLFETIFAFGYQRRGQLPTVNVATRTRNSRPRNVLLDMDWRSHLGIDHFPTLEQWEQRFALVLKTVRRALLEQADNLRIQFDCHLPLPAAFTLGYYFNVREANVGVWARQGDVSGLKRQLWFSKNRAINFLFEPEWVIRPKNDATVAVIELTTYASIATSVQLYLDQRGIRPNAHVRLPLQHNGESIQHIDEALALGYASQVGQLVRQLTAQGITDTYLFARIPSALAVLIGQRLLACNRIHLHWYQNPSYQYAFPLQ